MKSVIAQGATVAKAVEEAVKKAGNPKEFFIKILQDAQGGFLGFGSTKAKVALFFKKDELMQRDTEVLSQDSYKDLFDNKGLDRQLGEQDQHGSSNQPKARSSKGSGSMRRRSLNTSQQKTRHTNKSNTSTQKKVNEADQGNKEEKGKVSNRPRTRSMGRVRGDRRQGTRWGKRSNESRKKDDKDQS